MCEFFVRIPFTRVSLPEKAINFVKRPTQADVARLAGVSRATVSYVINENGGNRQPISASTRHRVLAAIAELGYEPDARARSLRSGGVNTVGLLVPDLHNPHYWEVVQGVEDELQKSGYDLLISSTSLDPDRERQALQALSQRRIDGLIVTLSFIEQSRRLLEPLVARSYPVVTLGKIVVETDGVMTSFRNAGRQVMHHLLDLGHQQIGFIFGVGSPDLGTNRMAVYHEAMMQADLPVNDALIVRCGPRLEDGYQAALHLLRLTPRPTALLAINDWLAVGALRAANQLGLTVPQDLSLASFDDTEMAAYLNPPLTSVRSSGEEIGRQAGRLVIERLATPMLPLRRVQIEAKLVVRDQPPGRGEVGATAPSCKERAFALYPEDRGGPIR